MTTRKFRSTVKHPCGCHWFGDRWEMCAFHRLRADGWRPVHGRTRNPQRCACGKPATGTVAGIPTCGDDR